MKRGYVLLLVCLLLHLNVLYAASSLRDEADQFVRFCQEEEPRGILLDEILVRQYAKGLSKPLRRKLTDCEKPDSVSLDASKMLLKCYREEKESETAICLEANAAEKLFEQDLKKKGLVSVDIDDIKCEVVKK